MVTVKPKDPNRTTHDSPSELRSQVRELVERARHSELLSRQFQAIELKVLAADTLEEMLKIVEVELRVAFGLPTVLLVLFDPDHEMVRILNEDARSREPLDLRVVSVHDSEVLAGLRTIGQEVSFEPKRYAIPAIDDLCARGFTLLALPLIRRDDLVGYIVLALGDSKPFDTEQDRELLERFTAIVAVALENGLNIERLKRAGLTDPLTAVNNRRFFDQRLREEWDRAYRSGDPLAALMVDVDHFKQINDRFGHQVGDQVLRQFAAVISGQMRNSDVLARYGGEEFVVLLPSATLVQAGEIAERLRKRLADHEFQSASFEQIPLTASIGAAVSVPKEPNQTADLLIETADAALYRAKALGRNRVVIA